MKKNVSFIVNGKIRKIEQLKAEITQLFTPDFEIAFYLTEVVMDGMRLAKAAIEKHGGYIISVGGDGMLNEVVNGVMAAGNPKVVLGVLPYGSGNDFSRSVKIQDDPVQLLEMIKKDQFREIDVGYAEFMGPDGKPDTRYYMNITDVGLGGLAVEILSKSKQVFGADFAYFWAIFRSFFGYKRIRAKLVTPKAEWEGFLLSLVMANGKFFGSGICIAPQAEIDDGLIQLVILGEVSVIDYLMKMPSVRKGKLIEHRDVHYMTAPSLEVTGVSEPLQIDMDGEFIGTTPLKVSLKNKGVRFLTQH